MLRAVGVLEHLEHLFLRRRRAHEVLVGTRQQFPAGVAQRGVVETRQCPRRLQVLVETLQDVQAVDVDRPVDRSRREEVARNSSAADKFAMSCRNSSLMIAPFLT